MIPLSHLLTLLADQPPDTVAYLILGYVIIGAVGLGYIVTLLLRQRNLRRELDVLERLEKDDD
jgi:CcmD family protein